MTSEEKNKREEATQELFRSEEYLRLIFDHGLDGIDICTEDSRTRKRRLVVCNDRYAEMSGRSREDLMAVDDLNELCIPVGAEGEARRSREPSADAAATRGRSSWLRPDGKENYYEWSAKPVRIGGTTYVVGIDRDITERVRSERQQARSERWFRLILENSFDGINVCTFDLETQQRRLVMCNDRYVEMSGRTREELMGVENLNDLRVLVECDPNFPELIRDGKPLTGIASWTRPDGKENYYEWTAVGVHIEGQSYIIGIDRDITERRRSVEALARSERWLRLILDNSFDGINVCTSDPETGARKLVMCNDRYVKMTGRTREELMAAEDIDDLVVKIERAPDFEERLHSGLPYQGVSSWIRPDGKENYFEWTCASFTLEGGKFFVGTDRDITERRLGEEALREQERRYRSLFENCPIVLWEEDFSRARQLIDGLRDSGVKDFRTYFIAHPDAVAACAEAVRVVDVNEASLGTYEAETKDQLLGGLPQIFTEQAYKTFAERLVRLVEGQTAFEAETTNRTLAGKEFDVALHWFMPPGYEDTWSRVFVAAIDITERNRAQKELAGVHQRLLEAREEERRRQARELHDSISQQLVALSLSFKRVLAESEVQPETPFSRALTELSGQCSDLIREVRAICHGLYPPTLESLGLAPALRQLAVESYLEAKITVRCPGPLETARFAGRVEIELFRIAQEAVNNALRHGQCKNVEVYLDYTAGRLTLAVTDDGRGFEAASRSERGMGLSTMSERARAIGGELDISSRPGETRILVSTYAEPPSGGIPSDET